MKKLVITTGAIVLGFIVSFGIAYAGGTAERGKVLFNDPELGGSTNSRSCNSCHPGGNGLEDAGNKDFTTFMKLRVNDLEDVINICIENPLKGKALDKDSREMKDLVAYIRSLSE